jgi:MFS family permease
MKRQSILRLLALMSLGFALTMLSNTLEPAVLGYKVLQLAPDRPNTALGFTTFAGLIVAILVQPIVGVLSDRTRSRWGRRLPFLAIGTLMVIACLLLIALAPDFALLVAGVLLIQFASNTVQGPWQALIPDQVAEHQRGQASSIKATFDILALIVGRLAAGQLVGRYSQWGQAAILAAIAVPSTVFVLALVITALTARERADSAAEHAVPAVPQRSVREALINAFRVDFRAHPAFGWWFANRLLFWAAFIALNTFLLFYAIDVIRLPQDQAQSYIGQLSTVLGAALVIVSIPAGWLADHFGRKPVVVAAGLIAALGTLLILFVREISLITLAAGVIGVGIGMFLSANWALVTDIVPRAEAARYLGIANIATAGGSAIARFLGGAMIDTLNAALGSSAAGYLALYGVAAVFFLLSAVVILPLPTPPPSAQSQATQ